MKKPIMLNVDKAGYEIFSTICKKKGFIKSRLVELFIERFNEKHS